MTDGLPILSGLDAIVNPDNVRPGIDLKDLERQMIKGGMVTESVQDPADRLNNELKNAAMKLGIDFGDSGGGSGVSSSYTHQEPVYTPTDHASEAYRDASDNIYSRSNVSSGSSPAYTRSPTQSYTQSYTPKGHDEGGYGGSSSYGSSGYSDYNNYEPESRTPIFSDTSRDSLLSRTLEEERRDHINQIVGNDENTSFSLEKEKKEDLKCMMLAEIDSLISSLQMEEVDLSRIPTVDNETSYEVVETTLKILRHKNDQTRACTFMEEFLMFGAYGLEELFDGKRVWLGKYSPDLTGWHNHLNVKLRRVRYDTGQFTSGLLEKYKIGPGTRMAFEIVPNLFLYSRMRKQQHSQPSLLNDVDDNEVEQATARISSL